jgi:phytoene dehydrogenase-like protein
MAEQKRIVDVIVAGAGHNGLVSAAYLAKAGLDTLVLEQQSFYGGLTSTTEMTPEAPGYFINEASMHASLFRTTSIFEDLELGTKYGLRQRVIDPCHLQMQLDGSSLGMWRDPQKTARELRHFSRKDADALLDLYNVIDAAVAIGVPLMQTNPTRPEFKQVTKALKGMAKNARELVAIGRWITCSQIEAIEDHFEHDIIRAPLLIQLPFMPFNADLGGWALIYLGILSKYGVSMFEGGTGEFPRALIDCMKDNGGDIRLSSRVEEMVVRQGRVVGVRLDDGEEFYARRGVLTAFSPKTTLTRMLPDGVLNDRLRNRAEHIPTTVRHFTDFKLNVALKGRLRMEKIEAWRGRDMDCRLPANSYHTYEEARAAQYACVRGAIPKHFPGLAQITTALSPHMAPDGCDTFWFWCGMTPIEPSIGWDRARDEIAQTIVTQSNHYYEGLEELEIARRPLGKPDIEERFGAIDGNIYHVDPTITRFGPLKPALGFAGYSTPVPGLFLTGSGTHPVAGISGMPGQNAAKTMIRLFKKEDGQGRAAHGVEEARNWEAHIAAKTGAAPEEEAFGVAG